QIPGSGFLAVDSAAGNIVCNDIVVRVLLKNLNVIERITARNEILNEPRAQVGTITKNLTLDVTTRTRLRLGKKIFASKFCMRRKRIVHGHACSYCEQAHADQRQQNALETYTRGEHGDDFIRPRHSTESKKERQQKRNWEQNDEYLRDLCGIITNNQKQTDALIDKGRNVIAHVENEPDGDEAGDAVKVDLQEIANDVSVEKAHCDLKRTQISSACQIMMERMTRSK